MGEVDVDLAKAVLTPGPEAEISFSQRQTFTRIYYELAIGQCQ